MSEQHFTEKSVLRIMRRLLFLVLIAWVQVLSATASWAGDPYLQLQNGAKLIYDLNSTPYRVFFQPNGKTPELIYSGSLTHINVSDVNNATIPDGVQLEIRGRGDLTAGVFNGKSLGTVVFQDGNKFQTALRIQKYSLLDWTNRELLISVQYVDGTGRTVFYNGKSAHDINRIFYSGTYNHKGSNGGPQWGGKDLAYEGSDGKWHWLPEASQIPKVFETAPRNFKPGQIVENEPLTSQVELDPVEAKLKEEVIEQDQVIDTYLNVWKRIHKPSARKKHGVVAVLGTTGTGKTFSAERFAADVLKDPKRLLELDGAQYTDYHQVKNLVGMPPGYLMSDKFKGILPEFLSGRGSGENVILINEIEKACPEFFTTLMEMLDKGKIQGGDGAWYDLGHSLIIFTSNKGADRIYPRGQGKALSRKELEERRKKFDSNTLKNFFLEADPSTGFDQKKRMPPEIANRINEYVVAMPISKEGALKRANEELKRATDAVKVDDGYTVSVSPEVTEHLVDSRYIPEDGIRPLLNDLDNFVFQVTEAARTLPKKVDNAVQVELSPATDDQEAVFLVTSGAETRAIPAPRSPHLIDNPLTDPSARRKLVGIEPSIRNTVFGQDEAVRNISRALRTKAINQQKKTPATAVLLGSTGTGKTELGKAVASEVFGDPRRLLRLDLGDVKNEAQFNNLFGSAKGYLGSDSVSPFEQFLINFPEGGVIMFDEVGNMGSGETGKTDLLKKFYPMLDEGEWRSPQGKVYDLRKYLILFSSNEGEEMFKGLPNDDLRIATWEEAKGKEAVATLLKNHGWPEALVARFQGNTILMKPLTEAEREYIAKKLFTTTFDQLAAQHPLKNFEVDQDFFKKAGTIFFSHTEGARKIRGVTEGALTDLIGEVLIDNFESKDLKHSTLHFAVTDNYDGVHSFEGPAPPKREVKLIATLRGPHGDKVYEADVTDDAAMKRLHSAVDLEMTAIHEAGHGVANIPEETGEAWDFVTVRGAGGYGGYARYRAIRPQSTHTRSAIIARLARMLAGREAEKIAGFPQNTGWSNDLEKAHELAKQAVTEYGLSRDPFKPKGSATADAEIQELLEEARKLAENRLRENWPAVREFADQLKSKGHMERAEIDSLLSKTSLQSFRAEFAKAHPNDPVVSGGGATAPVMDPCERLFLNERFR